MAQRKHKKRREPQPAPPPRLRGLWWWGLLGLIVAGGVAGAVLLKGRRPRGMLQDPARLPRLQIGEWELPVEVRTTRRDRLALVPEQEYTGPRPLRLYFARWSGPVAVLFVYPQARLRTLYLDPDLGAAPGRAELGLLFIGPEQKVDSVHRIGAGAYLARSRAPARWALFVPGQWIRHHEVKAGLRVRLPREAFGAAEPEWEPIRDPPPAVIRVGGVPLKVEIAHTRAHRSRGLMHRNHLPEGTGMLFLFPRARPQHFWMRNTRIPLDVAYIGEDLRILNVCTMAPHDMDQDGKYFSAGPAAMALETRAGWFRRHGLGRGTKVEVPAWVLELRRRAEE